MYEACNSLWKMVTLLKTLSLEDATDIATTLKEATLKNVIQTTSFGELDFSRALNVAKKEKLTFYDASYIVVAENKKATLVTDDEKLKKAAEKYVETINYSNLENKLQQRA